MSVLYVAWDTIEFFVKEKWQPAFLLHRRDYRETSVLADFFTEDSGVVSAVVKGARTARTVRVPLQPFSLLNIQWVGSSELKSLRAWEAVDSSLLLYGDRLFCGLYLNELLLRLLHRHDPCPQLFALYQNTLYSLMGAKDGALDVVLRSFEKQLLVVLGYGFSFEEDSRGLPIEIDSCYQFDAETGFIKIKKVEETDIFYSGETLIAISKNHYESLKVRQAAKRLMRAALNFYSGSKPFHSRNLFLSVRKRQQ